MTVTVHLCHGGTVVRVVGEIDLANSASLAHAIDEVCTAVVASSVPRPRRSQANCGLEVTCDLTSVEFLGVAGVSALEAATDAARRRGVTLLLVAAAGPARRVLDLITTDLTLHDSASQPERGCGR